MYNNVYIFLGKANTNVSFSNIDVNRVKTVLAHPASLCHRGEDILYNSLHF